jgi:hypothetical protein
VLRAQLCLADRCVRSPGRARAVCPALRRRSRTPSVPPLGRVRVLPFAGARVDYPPTLLDLKAEKSGNRTRRPQRFQLRRSLTMYPS